MSNARLLEQLEVLHNDGFFDAPYALKSSSDFNKFYNQCEDLYDLLQDTPDLEWPKDTLGSHKSSGMFFSFRILISYRQNRCHASPFAHIRHHVGPTTIHVPD